MEIEIDDRSLVFLVAALAPADDAAEWAPPVSPFTAPEPGIPSDPLEAEGVLALHRRARGDTEPWCEFERRIERSPMPPLEQSRIMMAVEGKWREWQEWRLAQAAHRDSERRQAQLRGRVVWAEALLAVIEGDPRAPGKN